MKKLILFICLLCMSLIGYAQAPEKATTIVVSMSDSIGLREKVLKVIADRGYTVSSAKTAAIISTAGKTLKNDARVAYYFQIKGKEIFITGKLPVAGQANFPIANQGKKGTPSAYGWEEMEKIAKVFAGGIRYE